MEEIRPKTLGSRDVSVFPIDFLSDGDSVYSFEKSFGILGTPAKACLICVGNENLLNILAVVIIFSLWKDEKNLGETVSTTSTIHRTACCIWSVTRSHFRISIK